MFKKLDKDGGGGVDFDEFTEGLLELKIEEMDQDKIELIWNNVSNGADEIHVDQLAQAFE